MGDIGRVIALSTSKSKGIPKTNVDMADFVPNWGITGDAHGGPGHRSVSLLATESIDKIRERGLDVSPGAFAENITTAGVNLLKLTIGDRVSVGCVLLEITQIGKECHHRCAIYEQAGDCVMPREGIFAIVINGGQVKPGDPVELHHSRSAAALRL